MVNTLIHIDTVNEDQTAEADLFKALADPVRLHILDILTDQGGTISVEELVLLVASKKQPTVSYHLAILHHAQLVQVQKVGLHSYYSVRPETIARARTILAQFQKEDIYE
jgi:ArsR family transcriptional regulator